MVGAFRPACLEVERESGQMCRPALARLKVVLPVSRCSDEEGNVDDLIEVVDDGKVGYVCFLG